MGYSHVPANLVQRFKPSEGLMLGVLHPARISDRS